MNYRNQTMNTNAGNCGISGRRRVRPDCGNTAQTTNPCGCTAPVSPTCNTKTTCTAETPASAICGCVSQTPSCGCVTPAPCCECDCVTPAPSCECGCITPTPCCECGCETTPACGCETSCCTGSATCGCVCPGNPVPLTPPFSPNAYCSNPAASDQLRGMPLAMAYVPWQAFCNLYGAMEGFHNGTIFKDLHFDFQGRRCN